MAVIAGPSGIGKSRLLAEMAGRAEAFVLAARAFLPEREEAWSLARELLVEALALDLDAARGLPPRAAAALGEVVPELVELVPSEDGPTDSASRRALALEAGVRVLAAVAGKGVLVLVDDLQWADATSLHLLSRVLARVPSARLALALRPEEVPTDSPVGSFLRDLPTLAGGVAEVSPGPLSEETIGGLFSDPELAVAVAETTDCTPLALGEVVRALNAEGAIGADLSGRWEARAANAVEMARDLGRAGQRRSIQARADRQPPIRREILRLLALLGREVPARVLVVALSRQPAAVLDDLDALARAGLVRLGEGGWATAHDLVGEVVAASLAPTEGARLHHLLAVALEAEGGDPAEMARHLAATGEKAGAASAFARAARQRLDRYAAEEATRLADLGLDLGPDGPVRSSLLETRAGARNLAGDRVGTRDDLRAALEIIPRGPARAHLLAQLALMTVSEGPDEGVGIIEVALAEAGSDPAARAEVLAIGAVIDSNAGHLDRSEARAAEAYILSEQLGDATGMATALDARASRACFAGRFDEAIELYDRAARLYRDAGALLRVGTPRVVRGWALMLSGRPEEGLADTEEALEIERLLGQVEGEAVALGLEADVLLALGRHEEAERHAQESLALSRRLGQRENTAVALRVLGKIHQARGDLEAADELLTQALDEAVDLGAQRPFMGAYLASLAAERGDLDRAGRLAADCLSSGVPVTFPEARLVLAEVALARGEAGAEARAAQALAEAEAAGWRSGFTLERLGRLVSPEAIAAAQAVSARRQYRVFMFTDIVGSTQLVEALGDQAWGDLLRWHDQMLRSLIAGHGGEEVNRMGDGFFVAFEQAVSAVDCAVAIQRALTHHRREHGFAPSVRIGLHGAEATREGDGYQGRAIHEAARIAALAAGGEILASRPAVTGAVPYPLSAPRTERLRGLAQPVELVSVDWRDPG